MRRQSAGSRIADERLRQRAAGQRLSACQDASAANTRGRGVDGERTGLYREWLRLVCELRPAWTCVENSPRLRTRGIDRLLAELESLDYTGWPLVVSAGDIGAPHERERVWIGRQIANQRNRMIAAMGDAILPQIAAAIGRAILSITRDLRP